MTGGLNTYSALFGPEIALNTPVVGGNDTVIGVTNWGGTNFQMPSEHPYYLVTGYDVLNGSVVNGNFYCTLLRVDANPPAAASMTTVSSGIGTAQSGAGVVQRVNPTSAGLLVGGGVFVHAFISSNSASARYGTTTVSSANLRKALTYAVQGQSIGGASANAWVAATEEWYIKVYGRPVG